MTLYYIFVTILATLLILAEFRVRKLERLLKARDSSLEKNRREMVEILKEYNKSNEQQRSDFKDMFAQQIEFMKSVNSMHSDNQIHLLEVMDQNKIAYEKSNKKLSEVIDNLGKVVAASSEAMMNFSVTEALMKSKK